MSVQSPTLATHFYCFEHDVWYEKDLPSICHECEMAICEWHDKQMEREMTKFYEKESTFEFVNDTKNLQEESLMLFAAALGYDPVTDLKTGQLVRFRQPRFACVGEEVVSVNRMILLHNNLADYIFEEIQINGYDFINETQGQVYTFEQFINGPKNTGIDAITALFAGTCKIVKKVKMTHSRERGLEVQSHKVEFNTRRDLAHYRSVVSKAK